MERPEFMDGDLRVDIDQHAEIVQRTAAYHDLIEAVERQLNMSVPNGADIELREAELGDACPYIWQDVICLGNGIRPVPFGSQRILTSDERTYNQAVYGAYLQPKIIHISAGEDADSLFKVTHMIAVESDESSYTGGEVIVHMYGCDSSVVVASEAEPDTSAYNLKNPGEITEMLLHVNTQYDEDILASDAFLYQDRDQQDKQLTLFISETNDLVGLTHARLIVRCNEAYVYRAGMDSPQRPKSMEEGRNYTVVGECLGLLSLEAMQIDDGQYTGVAEKYLNFAGLCLVIDIADKLQPKLQTEYGTHVFVPIRNNGIFSVELVTSHG